MTPCGICGRPIRWSRLRFTRRYAASTGWQHTTHQAKDHTATPFALCGTVHTPVKDSA